MGGHWKASTCTSAARAAEPLKYMMSVATSGHREPDGHPNIRLATEKRSPNARNVNQIYDEFML